MLEPIQHLLERELHARQNRAVGARNFVGGNTTARERQHGRTGGDDEREVSDQERESDNAASSIASRGSRSGDCSVKFAAPST